MAYTYRLENVDPKVTERLKKEKDAQREKEEAAWQNDLTPVPQETPVPVEHRSV